MKGQTSAIDSNDEGVMERKSHYLPRIMIQHWRLNARCTHQGSEQLNDRTCARTGVQGFLAM
jgi:hypothetical protein